MSSRTALPQPGAICKICTKDCLIECIKCEKCSGYVHTACSQLPVYGLVNYFNSRSQYICEGCVSDKLGDDKNDEQHAWVTELLERDNAPSPQKDSLARVSTQKQPPENQNVLSSEEKIKVAIGNLLQLADPLATPVVSAFDSSATRSRPANSKAFMSLTLDKL